MEDEVLNPVETAEVEINNDSLVDESKKGEDIYVENDISGLERMLGIRASSEEPETEELDNESKEEENIEEEIPVQEENIDIEEDKIVDTEESSHTVLLSDFMETDSDNFTFLERSGDNYSLVSYPLTDKKLIQKAVRSSDYIFRYPKLHLKDPVLGYAESSSDNNIEYSVYFPEYSLHFTVPMEYKKPYSLSFREYFDDLVSRIRPDNMELLDYPNSVSITSLKVIETGLLELNTDSGTSRYLLNNHSINFYAVLDYIRGVSDQGMDQIKLKFIPEFFVKL